MDYKLTVDKVVKETISDGEVKECVKTAEFLCESIIDRKDLHERDYLERYIDILMGEIAEKSVIKWFRDHGKFAESAVDKTSGKPDMGHDIILKSIENKEILCSVKSSLSVYKSEMKDILDTFTIATKKSELRQVNIQVYYWLSLKSTPRVCVPNHENMAIIGWVSNKDIESFGTYATEDRESPDNIKLRQIRSMESLLKYLI